MRTYRTHPGQRDTFLRTFESRLVPALRALGIRVLGPFRATDDDDTFCWLRGFPDDVSRADTTAAFYGSAAWQDDLKGALAPLLRSHHVTVVTGPHGELSW